MILKQSSSLRSFRLVFLLLTLLSLTPGISGSAQAADGAEKTVKLITVGNSFSGNACKYLEDIVKDGGHKIILGRANIGGCSLERHSKHSALHDADPEDPKGKPFVIYRGKGKEKASLKDLLESDNWDYVTIQQVSMKSFDPGTFEPFGKNLYDYIKKYAPNSEVLIHQTWAYRADDELFDKPDLDQSVMYQRLTENYQKLSTDCGGLRILPCGAAFQTARDSDKWNLKIGEFDPKAAQHPALPDTKQSLNVGWKWQKGRDGKFRPNNDGHHAGPNGEYLAGLIWYGVLFGEDPREIKFVPEKVDPADAALLREFAWQTLQEKAGWFARPPKFD